MLLATMEISSDYAADLFKLSLGFFDEDDEFNGKDGIIRDVGFQPLLDTLSQDVPVCLNSYSCCIVVIIIICAIPCSFFEVRYK